MTNSSKHYIKTISVESQHLDELNHVNNGVYVQWIQDIASAHWSSVRPHVDKEDAYWVVLEHHIKYLQQAFLNDQLRVETYVEPPEGVRFPRVVNFYRDNSLIVKARTLWCWVDTVSNRPKRITDDMLNRFL